jgi:hypothetical protein
MNNNLNKLKPFKILGKGSEGVVILTHDNRYSVKIYRKNPNENIIKFKDKYFEFIKNNIIYNKFLNV